MAKSWLFAIGMLAAVLGVAAVACSDDEESEAELTAQLCTDIEALRADGAAFGTLTETSTVDELQSIGSAYGSALNNVIDDAKALGEVRTEPIEAAYDNLDSAIDDIPDDASISEGFALIEPELVAVDNAYAQAFSGVAC